MQMDAQTYLITELYQILHSELPVNTIRTTNFQSNYSKACTDYVNLFWRPYDNETRLQLLYTDVPSIDVFMKHFNQHLQVEKMKHESSCVQKKQWIKKAVLDAFASTIGKTLLMHVQKKRQCQRLSTLFKYSIILFYSFCCCIGFAYYIFI